MSDYNINNLNKIKDFLNDNPTSQESNMYDKEKYLKTFRQLNAENIGNRVVSSVNASNTYIYNMPMGKDYYDSLSPEMKHLVNAVHKAFISDEEIAATYDEEVITQIITSNFIINYVSPQTITYYNMADFFELHG